MNKLWFNAHIFYWNIQLGGDRWYHIRISNLYPDFRIQLHQLGNISF